MKFEEALTAMREGKRVRQSHWGEDHYIQKADSLILDQEGKIERLVDIFGDWELYVEPKWRPVSGDWWIDSEGYVWEGRPDICSAEFGTERKTREQAEKACDKMREFNRLLAYVDEHAPDWESNFSRGNYNYYVFYHIETGSYHWASSFYAKIVGAVYMPENVAKKLVDDLNNGRVELWSGN